MPYSKINDDLYETSGFVNELLKMRDSVGQAFHVMDEAAQWNAAGGVDFYGTPIKTGNAKHIHGWWSDYVAGKPTFETRYSEEEGLALKIDKSLRNAILFSLRMNLHIRKVKSSEHDFMTGEFNEDGTINYDGNEYIVQEIGWIVEPKEFLAKCMGSLLNQLRLAVVTGMNSNYGQLTRGSIGTLFEDLCAQTHTILVGNYTAEITDIDVFDVQIGSQKVLINPLRLLSKSPIPHPV